MSCKNCMFKDRAFSRLLCQECLNSRELYPYWRPFSNADRIRSMPDEELAHLLHTAEEHIFSGNLWNYEQWRKWLKAPVEVDDANNG